MSGGEHFAGLRGFSMLGLRSAASKASCAHGRIACGESIASSGSDQ